MTTAPLTAPTIYFFGVTTGQSSSRRIFPHWMDILGRPEVRLVGVDLPLNGPPESYRQAVARVEHDPLALGAVITSHKLNTLNAARDLINDLTPAALMTGEISALYKRDSRLFGHATDPAASGQAMAQFIPPEHWTTSGASVLCLGAGGAATALAAYLTTIALPTTRPRHVIFVDGRTERLAALRDRIETQLPETAITFDYVDNTNPMDNDVLVADLPPSSLVINATGMGKDLPGSPLTDEAHFPVDGFAWDLNYRGALDFLRQARTQTGTRNLTVADGWHYFLLGWTTIIGLIFEVQITPTVFDRMAAAAAAMR